MRAIFFLRDGCWIYSIALTFADCNIVRTDGEFNLIGDDMNSANYNKFPDMAAGSEALTPFSSLIGESVVLIVNIRRCQVPLRCRIMDESLSDLLINIEPGWEMNVRKELILAVEQDMPAGNSRVN
jgi:hypothetical protein